MAHHFSTASTVECRHRNSYWINKSRLHSLRNWSQTAPATFQGLTDHMWPVVSILNSAGGDKCGPRAYRAEQSGAGLALKRAVKTPLGCRLESLGVLLAIYFHFSSFLFMTYRTPSLEPSPHIRPPIQVPRRPPPAPSPLLLLPTTLREAHLRIHFSAPRAMWMLWMLPFLSFNFLLLSRLVGTFASLGFHNNSTKGRGKGLDSHQGRS